jgi:hypothetical protein
MYKMINGKLVTVCWDSRENAIKHLTEFPHRLEDAPHKYRDDEEIVLICAKLGIMKYLQYASKRLLTDERFVRGIAERNANVIAKMRGVTYADIFECIKEVLIMSRYEYSVGEVSKNGHIYLEVDHDDCEECWSEKIKRDDYVSWVLLCRNKINM